MNSLILEIFFCPTRFIKSPSSKPACSAIPPGNILVTTMPFKSEPSDQLEFLEGILNFLIKVSDIFATVSPNFLSI